MKNVSLYVLLAVGLGANCWASDPFTKDDLFSEASPLLYLKGLSPFRFKDLEDEVGFAKFKRGSEGLNSVYSLAAIDAKLPVDIVKARVKSFLLNYEGFNPQITFLVNLVKEECKPTPHLIFFDKRHEEKLLVLDIKDDSLADCFERCFGRPVLIARSYHLADDIYDQPGAVAPVAFEAVPIAASSGGASTLSLVEPPASYAGFEHLIFRMIDQGGTYSLGGLLGEEAFRCPNFLSSAAEVCGDASLEAIKKIVATLKRISGELQFCGRVMHQQQTAFMFYYANPKRVFLFRAQGDLWDGVITFTQIHLCCWTKGDNLLEQLERSCNPPQAPAAPEASPITASDGRDTTVSYEKGGDYIRLRSLCSLRSGCFISSFLEEKDLKDSSSLEEKDVVDISFCSGVNHLVFRAASQEAIARMIDTLKKDSQKPTYCFYLIHNDHRYFMFYCEAGDRYFLFDGEGNLWREDFFKKDTAAAPFVCKWTKGDDLVEQLERIAASAPTATYSFKEGLHKLYLKHVLLDARGGLFSDFLKYKSLRDPFFSLSAAEVCQAASLEALNKMTEILEGDSHVPTLCFNLICDCRIIFLFYCETSARYFLFNDNGDLLPQNYFNSSDKAFLMSWTQGDDLLGQLKSYYNPYLRAVKNPAQIIDDHSLVNDCRLTFPDLTRQSLADFWDDKSSDPRRVLKRPPFFNAEVKEAIAEVFRSRSAVDTLGDCLILLDEGVLRIICLPEDKYPSSPIIAFSSDSEKLVTKDGFKESRVIYFMRNAKWVFQFTLDAKKNPELNRWAAEDLSTDLKSPTDLKNYIVSDDTIKSIKIIMSDAGFEPDRCLVLERQSDFKTLLLFYCKKDSNCFLFNADSGKVMAHDEVCNALVLHASINLSLSQNWGELPIASVLKSSQQPGAVAPVASEGLPIALTCEDINRANFKFLSSGWVCRGASLLTRKLLSDYQKSLNVVLNGGRRGTKKMLEELRNFSGVPYKCFALVSGGKRYFLFYFAESQLFLFDAEGSLQGSDLFSDKTACIGVLSYATGDDLLAELQQIATLAPLESLEKK